MPDGGARVALVAAEPALACGLARLLGVAVVVVGDRCLSGVQQTLAKLRAWSPYDGDVWLDDAADALDDVPPAEEEVEELAQRLRGYLMQLVSIAINREAEQRHQRAGTLIARARQVREQQMAGDYWQAITHLRCMGWTVSELLEVLVEIGAVKEPDSLKHPLRAAST